MHVFLFCFGFILLQTCYQICRSELRATGKQKRAGREVGEGGRWEAGGRRRGFHASAPLLAAVDSKGETRFAPDGLSQWQNENADFTGSSHVFLLLTEIKNGRSFVTDSPRGYGGGGLGGEGWEGNLRR